VSGVTSPQEIYLEGTGISGLPVPYYQPFEESGGWPYAWNNVTGDDIDWTMHSGGTPSSNTGPSGDHTTGSGYYIYTEASSPNYPGMSAYMETPVFDLTGVTNPTMIFWYHMYGAAMGDLHLDALVGGVWQNDVMLVLSGNMGNQWNMQIVDLSSYTSTVKFRFRGITGTSYTSDMAIDDFEIIENLGVPTLLVDPTSLDFGTVWVGNTNALQFTIENTGQGTLQGDITTPAGYSVVEITDGINPDPGPAENTITYSVPFLTTKVFEVTFAPVASQSYDDVIAITSNDPNNPSFDLQVLGTGVIGPDIDVNPMIFDVTLPPDGSTVELMTIDNLGDVGLEYNIVAFDTDFIGGKMEGYFDQAMMNKIASKPDNSNQTVESDPSVTNNEEFVLPMIKKFGDDSDGEEIFGSWSSTWTGGNRDRGNIFHVTTATLLSEQRFYLNISASTDLYFFVYEGAALSGNFTKIAENHIQNSGTGEQWYSSGSMIVNLEAGKYYYIGTAWGASAEYGRGNESVPLPCSFGTLETGIPGIVAGYPPANTCNSTYTGFSPYYQTIVTGPVFTWLVPNPTTGIVQSGQSEVIDLTFDATGLTEGTYTKDLIIYSNDPDEPAVTVPVTLTVSDVAIVLDVNVMLDGPFTGSFMTNFLNAYGYLPLNQPYNEAPWNYYGTEAVAAIPTVQVVDWLLVEVRDAPDAGSAGSGTMLGKQAAFVLNDGSVVGLDGASHLNFASEVTQNLFVVIWHRNHLAIMSGYPVVEMGGVYSYSFYTGANQAYGGFIAHKDIGGGIWGMIGGDGNGDGQVSIPDKVEIWYPQVGLSGYLDGDFDLNDNVDNLDKLDIWGPNSGSGIQIPDYTPPGGFKCQVPE
ncbi:MAG: hypothetical protein K8R53_11650, partial [Bacteroidales bacterium]|nr:hypothetical protein [Bacteroidales bacterium]